MSKAASLEQLGGKIWFDGELIDGPDAKAHVLSHSLHYGAAVWEGVRAYATAKGGAVFRLQDHTRRLVNSAKIMGMSLPFDEATLNQAQLDILRANNLEQAYIRPIAYYGGETLGVRTRERPLTVHVAIAVWPWKDYLGAGALENGVRVGVSSYARLHPRSNLYKAKAVGNYINSVLATNEAHAHGYHEALLLDHQGHIAEGSGQNFFIVRDGVMYTPDLASVLEGITRDSVLKIASDLNISIKEARITRDDAYIADEAFFTGTAVEITPICEIDGRKIGSGKPGPISLQIQQEYLAAVKGEHRQYQSWLTYLNVNANESWNRKNEHKDTHPHPVSG